MMGDRKFAGWPPSTQGLVVRLLPDQHANDRYLHPRNEDLAEPKSETGAGNEHSAKLESENGKLKAQVAAMEAKLAKLLAAVGAQ